MGIGFVFVIGLIIGSFLNVCIYRIIREESVVFPPSHCTSCGYELRALDLIPVVSYAFLRGRCRICSEKISIRYPVVELLNGILYIMVYVNYGLTLDFFMLCLFISLLIVVGFIDFDTKYVFNSTVNFGFISAGVFLIFKWLENKSIPWNNIFGGVIGFAIIALIVVLTRAMGEGDIDIALICGLFLGVKGIIVTLFLAFVLGGILAILSIVLKIKSREDEMAFGPYLAIGAVVAALWGENLIEIYSMLFL